MCRWAGYIGQVLSLIVKLAVFILEDVWDVYSLLSQTHAHIARNPSPDFSDFQPLEMSFP